MMHRLVTILLLALLIITGSDLSAQQKKTDNKQPQNNKKSSNILKPLVYLGNSDYTGGPIKKDVFNNFLKQGLVAHDSLGNKYRVIGFNFGYAERNLYEDSVGNLVTMTDYSFEYCAGDTVSGDISHTKNTAITNYLDGDPDNYDVSKSIYNRVKPGDTIYFDQIKVVKYINATQSLPDSAAVLGRSLKCWIIK